MVEEDAQRYMKENHYDSVTIICDNKGEREYVLSKLLENDIGIPEGFQKCRTIFKQDEI